MTSRLLTTRRESACAGLEYRARPDLHATERALIAAVAPLCGNSARGGFRHQPELSPFDDPHAPATIKALERINDEVEEHLRDAKAY